MNLKEIVSVNCLINLSSGMARKFFKTKPISIIILSILCLGTVFFLKSNIKTEVIGDHQSYLLKHVNNLINTGNKDTA